MGVYPKEYTKEEWKALTKEQREEHKQKKQRETYVRYNQSHREQRNKYAAERYKKMREFIKSAEGGQLLMSN